MKALFNLGRNVYFFSSKRWNSSYYITTPIFYVNASPHIGHLYSALIADAYHRFQLMTSSADTIFSVGTDEHGTKIQQAAQAKAIPPNQYCDQITSEFKSMFDQFNIGYTDFIHTSDEKHKKCVQMFWNQLVSNKSIYKGSYSGWYCDADEAFLTEDQLKTVTQNGKEVKVSAESGRPCHWVEEENYKFRLSNYKDDLIHWVKSGGVKPALFEKMVSTWLESGVADRDVSVSRPVTRVHWAVPVPSDPQQTVYVWLDALINYLTIAGYPDLTTWPPNHQVIGKDILKFHAVYWPAFLLAAGLPPPSHLIVHSHWTVDSEKMSKSRGNVVCPFQDAKKFTSDGLRYFLLREGTLHSDSNYSETKVMRILNAELADTLGNLLNRCSAKTVNKWQTFPPLVHENFKRFCQNSCPTLIQSLESMSSEVMEHFAEFNFYKGIDRIISSLHETNRWFEVSKPWELAKSTNNDERLQSILHVTMEALRISALCLQPIVPNLSSTLLDKLSVPQSCRSWQHAVPSWTSNLLSSDTQLSQEKVMLYRRIIAKA